MTYQEIQYLLILLNASKCVKIEYMGGQIFQCRWGNAPNETVYTVRDELDLAIALRSQGIKVEA